MDKWYILISKETFSISKQRKRQDSHLLFAIYSSEEYKKFTKEQMRCLCDKVGLTVKIEYGTRDGLNKKYNYRKGIEGRFYKSEARIQSKNYVKNLKRLVEPNCRLMDGQGIWVS
jgi:hypothetical protein